MMRLTSIKGALVAAVAVLFLTTEFAACAEAPAPAATTANTNWVVDFIEALVWPLVAIVALILLRRPLLELLDQTIRRVRKVSVYEISIELATLPALMPSWSHPQIDARKLSPAHLIDSYTETLFTQLSKPADAEYAIIDLGAGKEWLTSRLFLFSYILGQTAHLRTFVFLEKAASGRKSFLGIAAPSAVWKALATQYPWFEEALLRATVNATLPPQPADAPKIQRFAGTAGLSIFAPTDWQRLRNIAQNFVGALQRTTDPPDAEKKSI